MDAQNGLKVVLVDDSEIIRNRVRSALETINGITAVLQADNVDSGRQLLESHEADVAILDVDLGGKNGMDLLSAVKRQGRRPVVIMLSNYDHPKLRERCLEMGADHYVHKATEFEKIIDLTQRCAGGGKASPRPLFPSNADLLNAARSFRVREERYRALYERLQDCIFILDMNGRFLDVNAAGLALHGYTAEEIPTLTLEMLVDPAGFEHARAAIAEVVRTGALQKPQEFLVRRKDGSKLTVEVNGSLIVRDGKPYAIHGISRDISARKQAEAEIQRLNRLYAVLSQVNQTLIGAANREELFRKVCEIAVKQAGFQAAVITWLDTRSMAVLPIAYYGAPESALKNIKVFADGRPEGRGPTGTAVREGEPCVVNDVQADPRTALWRESARNAGVLSAGSFPIRVEGVVWGSLSLYASEINVFHEKEISLLSTVADNISSALDHFEESARKDEAEALLKASQERYGVVLRETGQAVFDFNPAMGLVTWNGASEEVLSHILRDMQPLSISAWRQYIHPDDREKVAHKIERAIQQQRRYEIEYRVRRKDGAYEYIEERGSFFFEADSGTHRVLGTISKIAERKAMEEHLRDQARLLDLAHDAILVLDLNEKILYWNSGAQRTYGWTTEQALGREVTDLLGQPSFLTAQVRQTLLERDEWSGELTHLTAERQKVLVEARLTLVRDREGRPKSILSINTDITERKKLETQFLRAQRMESIGILAGGIAHDLNNVFAPIIMAADLLAAESPDSDRKQLYSLVHSSAQRGANLVRQICAFSRGTEGGQDRIQLNSIIREIHNLLKETLPKSIQLKVIAPRDLWVVDADPTQIYQVLMNLCINARDAMPAGGSLTISAENTTALIPPGQLPARRDPAPYVRLVVSDTGTGIPAEIREKIFDPFFTTKETGKGTGLGLSTTLGIIKRHGGFINLYSEPGKGTTFNVYLPAFGASKPGAERAPEANLPRGAGELVMVVDDEASIRAIATQTLQTFGYQSISAADGAEAVKLYRQHGIRISAVVVDVIMPVMDGLTTIQALKSINPNVKIIAASGLSPEAHGIQVSPDSVRAFLLKPYNSQTLLKALHEALNNSGPGESDTERIL